MRSPLKVCLLLALSVSVAFCGWGCTEVWTGPVTPVNPVPPPTPITPVPPPTPPVPVDPAAVIPYATIQAATALRTKAEVYAAIGKAPLLESVQDDRNTTARWATTNKDGEPRFAVFTFDPAGGTIGHVLLPRNP